MPTVPIYAQRVRPRGFGGELRSFETPESQGAGVGRALGELGANVGRLSDRMAEREFELQERTNVDAARRAFNTYNNHVRELLHDPQTGLYSRRGVNARDVTRLGQDDIDRVGASIEAELGNADQIRRFRQLSQTLRTNSLTGLSRHEVAELRVAERESTEEMVKGAVASMAANATDPDAIADHLSTARTALVAQANAEGWTREVLLQRQEDVTSAGYAGVVDRLLVDDPSAARAFYDAKKDEIGGNVRAKLERALKEGVTRQQAQAATDAIVAQIGTESLSAMLAEARQISDPELRDAVVDRVKIRHAEGETQRNNEEKIAKTQAWTGILEGGSSDQIPPALWAELPHETQRQIHAYEEKRAKGEEPKTDPEVYYMLSQLSNEEFAKVNLMDHVNKLSLTDFKSLASKQNSVESRNEREAAKRTSVSRALTAAKIPLQSMGIKTGNSASNSDKRLVAEFQTVLTQELTRFQDEKGGPATDLEVNALINQLLTRGEVPGSIVDPDVLYFESLATGRGDEFFIDTIPDDERDAIERALRSSPKAMREVTGRDGTVDEDALEKLIIRLYTVERLNRQSGSAR